MQVFLEGENISRDIALERTAERASVLASYSEVRTALTERQRLFAIAPGLVADGRDMGTVVFPDAVLKLFLTATIETRAKRRYKQLLLRGDNVSLPAIWRQLQKRDQRDSERSVSPLVPAIDAIKLDSTDMSVEGVVDALMDMIVARGICN
jgi:cytidylate kinase